MEVKLENSSTDLSFSTRELTSSMQAFSLLEGCDTSSYTRRGSQQICRKRISIPKTWNRLVFTRSSSCCSSLLTCARFAIYIVSSASSKAILSVVSVFSGSSLSTSFFTLRRMNGCTIFFSCSCFSLCFPRTISFSK